MHDERDSSSSPVMLRAAILAAGHVGVPGWPLLGRSIA